MYTHLFYPSITPNKVTGSLEPIGGYSGYKVGDTLGSVTTHLRAKSYTTDNIDMLISLQYMFWDWEENQKPLSHRDNNANSSHSAEEGPEPLTAKIVKVTELHYPSCHMSQSLSLVSSHTLLTPIGRF